MGRGVSQGWDLRFPSLVLSVPLSILLLRYKLSAPTPASFLPAAMLPTMMSMNSLSEMGSKPPIRCFSFLFF